MADTDTGISAAPQPEQGGQVLTVIDGQCMRSLWKSGLLVLVLTALFVAYLLIKPGGPARVTFIDNIIQGLLEGAAVFHTGYRSNQAVSSLVCRTSCSG